MRAARSGRVPVAGVVLAAVDDRGPARGARTRSVGARPLLLVLRALGLGDLLTGVPALRALRAAFPEHRLVLAAPRALAPLAELTGAVDAVADAAPLAPLDASVAEAEVAVNLHGRGPQSHRVLLATRPRRTVAFEHDEISSSRGGPEWHADEHETERWCRLLTQSGIPADPGRLDLPLPAPGTAPLEPVEAARGATLVHPGAASGARRWPADRYAAVARAERERGARVVVTGSRSEVELAREVARSAGLSQSAVVAGRGDMVTLAATVGAAARVVCGDTGVAHLATALGTPSVVLFGPTSPELWGPPPGRRHRHRPLWAGRTGDPHADEPDPGLLELEVGDVIAALSELPEGEGSTRAYAAGSPPAAAI
jgi:ADP-heptose:LPS heptosyltransferase